MVGSELRRAFSSKAFWWTCIITFAMLVFGSMEYIGYRIGNVLVTSWWVVYLNAIYLGMGTMLTLFYPIVVMVPYVLSYRRERDSGYIHLLLLKASRKRYLVAKATAVACSAFLAMLLPNLCWILICRFALGVTDSAYDRQRHNIFFALSLYDGHPGVYVVLWAVHIAVLGAVFAVFGLGISSVIKNRYLAILLPFCYCIFSSSILSAFQKSFAALDLLPFQLYHNTGQYPLGYYTVPIYEAVLAVLGIALFVGGDCHAGKA